MLAPPLSSLLSGIREVSSRRDCGHSNILQQSPDGRRDPELCVNRVSPNEAEGCGAKEGLQRSISPNASFCETNDSLIQPFILINHHKCA